MLTPDTSVETKTKVIARTSTGAAYGFASVVGLETWCVLSGAKFHTVEYASRTQSGVLLTGNPEPGTDMADDGNVVTITVVDSMDPVAALDRALVGYYARIAMPPPCTDEQKDEE